MTETNPGQDNWLRMSALILPVAALAVSAFVWYRTSSDIRTLRESQRTLSSDVASLRRTPIIEIANAPATGSADAPVALVEFSDYECPFCIRHFQQTMPQIEANYIRTGKVRYVFRDFPVDQLHPAAIRAHEAARCAAEQNKFWELHARLFTPAGTHTPDAIEQRATEIGLNLTSFRACVAAGRTTEEVRRSVSQAVELGATGTPAFFVGTRDRTTDQVKVVQAITGAQPYAVFEKTIEAVLKQAQAAAR